MIKEFGFTNYRSFKEDTTLTMEADLENVSEFPGHVLDYKNESLLKVASFYGPNASGKSNILKALFYFKRLIIYGIVRTNLEDELDYRIIEEINREIPNFENFSFCDPISNVMKFKLFLICGEYEIGFELHLEKSKAISIKYENMSFKKLGIENEFINLYERNGSSIKLGKQFSQYKFGTEAKVSDQLSFATFAKKLYVNETNMKEQFFEIISLFFDEINNITYYPSLRDYSMKNGERIALPYKSKELTQKVLSVLKDLDIDISDIQVEKGPNNILFRKGQTIRSLNGNAYLLDINEESDGTKTLLHLLPAIIEKLERGGVLLIDEIDAHLHPKLTNAIVHIFTDVLNTKTQLLFTSHDILNMTNELFRRDEIWFVVKDKHLSSHLFALTDFVNYKGEKIRKDAKYSKQYLEGKFAADPFIEKGIYWNGKNS